MAHVTWTYFSEPSAEQRMNADLETFISQERLDSDTAHALFLSVSEAFTNALLHANRLDPTRKITVFIEVNDRQVRADISDQGERGLDDIRRHRPTGLLAEHGRGIGLMRYYARRVDFSETSSGGLKVSLLFDRKTITEKKV